MIKQRKVPAPNVAGEEWRISDPTARADAIAEEVREWYEKHRETWWERQAYTWMGGRAPIDECADNFMLWLIGEVQASIERMKKKDLELPEAEAESGKATGQKERIEIDFPGQVYWSNPRLTMRDAVGNISLCREATIEEYFLWRAEKEAPLRFISAFKQLSSDVFENAKTHGWWDTERNDGEMIGLMHSELSEALEAIRNGNPPDDKIPEYLGTEAELADVIIRIMDMAHARKWRVGEAVIAKMEMNKRRPYKHGRKAF